MRCRESFGALVVSMLCFMVKDSMEVGLCQVVSDHGHGYLVFSISYDIIHRS